MKEYSTDFYSWQEPDDADCEAYDYFNDGYPGDMEEYSEFEGWRDLVW